MPANRPVLWQLRVSHFNEKARWALDYKGIVHERRSILPGWHSLRAMTLAGGKTLPVLELGDRRIQGSAEIVAAIEELQPEPALIPSDPGERSRALEIQAHFDELGHDVRRVLFDELLEDPALFVELFYVGHPDLLQRGARGGFAASRPLLRRNYRVNAESAIQARDNVVEGLDMIERELGSDGYLVGERFSVADLTAAALLFPIVLPPEYPYPLPDPSRMPPGARRFRDSVSEHPGFRWAQDTYRRHRSASAEALATA